MRFPKCLAQAVGLAIAIVCPVHAATPVESGVAWLGQQVRTDGSLIVEGTSLATAFEARTETLLTLKALSATPPSNAQIDLIAADEGGSAEYLARKVSSLAAMGRDASAPLAALLATQGADGGFAASSDYQSNPLDTAYALLALKAGNAPADRVSRAVAALVAFQAGDGSFSIYGQPSVYVTALAMQGLRAHAASNPVASPLASARAWLLSVQTAGAYPSTLDTAVATIAIAGSTTDTALFAGAQQALRDRQSPDGSWTSNAAGSPGDPFVTALALRALAATADAPVLATTGEVRARAVEDSGTAIADVTLTATLGAQSVTAATGSDGRATLPNLAPGTYSVRFSKAGYATVTVSAAVTAGVSLNLGDVRMQVGTTAAGLQGTIRHGQTGDVLSGASVSLGAGVATTTDAAGNYRVTGTPGPYQVTVSKTGFDTIVAAGTLVSGTMIVFSPAMYPAGQTPNSATLRGKVVAAATQQPIEGATVNVGGVGATTSAAGLFEITGLTAGAIEIEISKAGFATRRLTSTIAAGVNDVGTLSLSTPASTLTLSGRVTELGTSTPLGGALIRVQGTQLSGTSGSDGTYQVAGIASPQFVVEATAAGFRTKTVSVSLPQIANATLDLALERVQGNGLVVKRVTTNRTAYGPFSSIEVEMELDNTAAAARTLGFRALIIDSLGKVILQTPLASYTLAAGGLAQEVEVELHNTSEPPGLYTALMQGVDTDGTIVVEGGTSFTILEAAALSGGLAMNPPIAQASAKQPVTVTAELFNHGNKTITAGAAELTVTLEALEPNYNPVGQVAIAPYASGAPLDRPAGGVYDASGTLWVLNLDTPQAIVSIAPTTPPTVTKWRDLSTLSPPVADARDMALDPTGTGTLLVATVSGKILKVSLASPTQPVTTLTTGMNNVTGIARAASGTVYLATAFGDTPVSSIDMSTGAASPFLKRGLGTPAGVAGAPDGTLYVSNSADNAILKVSPAGAITVLASGAPLSSPRGLAVDGQGNVLVANNGSNTVLSVSAAGAIAAQPYATGLDRPLSLAMGQQGELFVGNAGADSTRSSIMRVAAGGGAGQLFARALAPLPNGLAYDAAGTLYVGGQDGAFAKVDAAGVATTLPSWPGGVHSVAAAAATDVFAANVSTGDVYRYNGSSFQTYLRTATGLNAPGALAWKDAANLYVLERGFPVRVSVLTPGTGARQTVVDNLVTSAEDIAFGVSGERYVLNATRISRIGPSSGELFATSGFDGVALVPAPAGGFYVQERNALRLVSPQGVASTIKTGLNILAKGAAIGKTGLLLVAEATSRKVITVDPANGALGAQPFADLAAFGSSIIAITSDGDSGVFAVLSGGAIVRVLKDGGNPTQPLAMPAGFSSRALAFDAPGNTLYVKGTVDVRAVNMTTLQTTVLAGIGDASTGGIAVAAGQLHVGHGDNRELLTYTPQGSLVATVAGFGPPSGMAWDGTRLYISDAVKVVSLVPGQLPQTLLREVVGGLAHYNGALYATRGGQVMRLPAGGTTFVPFFTLANSLVNAVAVNGSGSVTMSNQVDHRVVTVNPSAQVVRTFTAVGTPNALAVDAQGNVYVAASASQYSQVTRILADASNSTLLHTSFNGTGLAFLGGQLYAARSGFASLFRIDTVTGGDASVATATNASLGALATSGSALFVLDLNAFAVRRYADSRLDIHAAGINRVQTIRTGADGAIYAGTDSGSVVRVLAGEYRLLAGDLGSVAMLAAGPSGRVYSGNGTGMVTGYEPQSFRRTDLAHVPGLVGGSSGSLQVLAIDAAERIHAGLGNPGDIYRLTYTPPPAPPALGSAVIAPQMVNIPEIPVGKAAATVVPLPAFTPPYGGDFKFTLRKVDGTPGSPTNVLHVGPAATGTMTASKAAVPAGNSLVRVTTRVQGADYTTISTIDPARVTPIHTNFPNTSAALGMDAAGNLYFRGGGGLARMTPGGVQTTVWSAIGSLEMIGSIPVDSAGLIYVVAGVPTGTTIYALQPQANGTAIVAKSVAMPEKILSIVRDSRDVIWALGSDANKTAGHVYEVTFGTPAFRRLPDTTPIRTPFALTIDAKDNVYVQTGAAGGSTTAANRLDGVMRINRDGVLSPIVTIDAQGDPVFEYEGMAIAGDCGDNLLMAPIRWSKFGQVTADIEEHVLVQMVGATGKVGLVIDTRSIDPVFQDLDSLHYDRFSNSLIVLNEQFFTGGSDTVHRVPISCGSINTKLHIVTPPGQASGNFSISPTTSVTAADGSTEMVWDLQGVEAVGQSIAFDATLANLALGERRAVASEAFLTLQNSFVSGEVRIPIALPSVNVDGQVDVAAATDHDSYPANAQVTGAITLRNRDSIPRTGALTVEVYDAQGVFVARVLEKTVTVAANAAPIETAGFNTGTYLTGGYRMKAVLRDAGGVLLSSDTAAFDIVSEGTRLLSSLSTDRPEYEPLSMVTVQARLKNVSLNSIANPVAVTVVIRDAAGAEVLRDTRTVGPLVPGALQDAFFQFRLRQQDVGTFSVEMTGSDSAVQPRTSAFTVLSTVDTGTGLRGSISTRRFANKGDAVDIQLKLENFGNASVSGMPVTLRVIDAAGQAPVSWTLTAAVGKGGESIYMQAWTANLPRGNYAVAATGTIGGREIALGQRAITLGEPDVLTFASVTGVAAGAPIESQEGEVTGIVAPASIAVLVGEYKLNAGGFTGTSGIVLPKDKVQLRLTAPDWGLSATATLRINGVDSTFTVSSRAARTDPGPFAFAPVAGAAAGALVVSGSIQIQNIDIPVRIVVLNGEYQINGGAWQTAPSTVSIDDLVRVRVRASSVPGGVAIATLEVSNRTAEFRVTTDTQAVSPKPFAFIARNDVPRSTPIESNQVTIEEIAAPLSISISAGGEFAIDQGAFTAVTQTIANGQKVKVRVTSSAEFSKAVTTELTVGGFKAPFSVTTEGEDRTPEPFTFAPRAGVELLAPVESEPVTIAGINVPVAITVQGGEYRIGTGPFASVEGSVNAGDKVVVRLTSAGTFAAAKSATVTIGGVSANFTATTKAVADVRVLRVFEGEARILVLLTCKLSGQENAADDPSCIEQRRPFLASQLTALGLAHRIVTTTDAFKVELRSGAYNAYWISGGAAKLMDTLAEEVREAAFRGESLIVDGIHDERNRDLDEVVGIIYRGKPSQIASVTLTGPRLAAGSFDVAGAGAIRAELTSAIRQGRFNTGDPAISTSAYGAGKGLLFAFDLTGTLLAQSASALLRETLAELIDQVVPAPPAVSSAGAYLPLTIAVTNREPVAVDLKLEATLPAGFTVASGAPPAIVAGNLLTWTLTVPTGQTSAIDWAVRVGSTAGAQEILVAVSQTYGTTTVPLTTLPLLVSVRIADQSLAAAITELQALSLASNADRNLRDRAVTEIQDAQAKLAQSRFEDAIAALVAAGEDLDAISGADLSATRQTVGVAMQEIQRRWWASLPACPASPLCRN